MRDIISLRDATRAIDAGEVFTCTVVKYDRKRKTGGEIVELTAQLAATAYDRPHTKYESNKLEVARAQNHHDNYTRNVCIVVEGTTTGMIRKMHPPLMLTFNDKIVMP
jgi:hypothetical protein